MKILEQAKLLISQEEIKDNSIDFLGDCASALLGDPVAMGKIILSILKSPTFFREQWFWTKFELFLHGIDAEENERASFCKKLSENENSTDNAYRLLQIIDNIDTRQKVTYLVNASRCLSIGFIKLPLYFRICHVIRNCLEEDLVFLKNHILENSDYKYSDIIQGLMDNGLMYQSIIDENGNDVYNFTPIAKLIDIYAISYNDVNKYPSPLMENIDYSNKTTKANIAARFA